MCWDKEPLKFQRGKLPFFVYYFLGLYVSVWGRSQLGGDLDYVGCFFTGNMGF